MKVKKALLTMAFALTLCSAGFLNRGFETKKVYAETMDEVEAQVKQVITGETNITYNTSGNYTYTVKFVPKKTGEYLISTKTERSFKAEFKNGSFDNLGSSSSNGGKLDYRFYVVSGNTYYMRFTSSESNDINISVKYNSENKIDLIPKFGLQKRTGDTEYEYIDISEYEGKGIKWDPSTLTLELNNYNEDYCGFYVNYTTKEGKYTPSSYYFDGKDLLPNNGEVNIIIKGNNTINVYNGMYDAINVVHNINTKICGDGILNINYDVKDTGKNGVAVAGYSNIIMDGPTINITSNAKGFVIQSGDGFIINSGTINITHTNSTAIIQAAAPGDFHMNGGNLNIICTKENNENSRTNPVFDVENAYINGGKIDIKTNIESNVFAYKNGHTYTYSLNEFVMKDGMLVFHALPSFEKKEVDGVDCAIYATLVYADTVDISGGTIIIDYEKSDKYEHVYGWNPFIWEFDFKLSNTQTFIMGDKSVIDELNDKNNGKFNLYDMYNFYENEDDLEKEEWKKHTYVDKTASVKVLSTLDISTFGISLLEDVMVYDGKAKEPKVDLKGLVNNKQVKVTYTNNINTGEGTVTITGIAPFTGKVILKFKIIKSEAKIGTIISDGKYIYKVVKAGKVTVIGLKKKSIKTIKIADKVKIDGFSYKITSISSNAFKNNKKIKKVIIGKNVTSIGKKAFYGNKKLKKVIVKSTKLKKIGKKTIFRKGGKKIVFKVPKKKIKKYKKLLKTAGTKKYIVKK